MARSKARKKAAPKIAKKKPVVRRKAAKKATKKKASVKKTEIVKMTAKQVIDYKAEHGVKKLHALYDSGVISRNVMTRVINKLEEEGESTWGLGIYRPENAEQLKEKAPKAAKKAKKATKKKASVQAAPKAKKKSRKKAVVLKAAIEPANSDFNIPEKMTAKQLLENYEALGMEKVKELFDAGVISTNVISRIINTLGDHEDAAAFQALKNPEVKKKASVKAAPKAKRKTKIKKEVEVSAKITAKEALDLYGNNGEGFNSIKELVEANSLSSNVLSRLINSVNKRGEDTVKLQGLRNLDAATPKVVKAKKKASVQKAPPELEAETEELSPETLKLAKAQLKNTYFMLPKFKVLEEIISTPVEEKVPVIRYLIGTVGVRETNNLVFQAFVKYALNDEGDYHADWFDIPASNFYPESLMAKIARAYPEVIKASYSYNPEALEDYLTAEQKEEIAESKSRARPAMIIRKKTDLKEASAEVVETAQEQASEVETVREIISEVVETANISNEAVEAAEEMTAEEQSEEEIIAPIKKKAVPNLSLLS